MIKTDRERGGGILGKGSLYNEMHVQFSSASSRPGTSFWAKRVEGRGGLIEGWDLIPQFE